jgi:hypothetical protein
VGHGDEVRVAVEPQPEPAQSTIPCSETSDLAAVGHPGEVLRDDVLGELGLSATSAA